MPLRPRQFASNCGSEDNKRTSLRVKKTKGQKKFGQIGHENSCVNQPLTGGVRTYLGFLRRQSGRRQIDRRASPLGRRGPCSFTRSSALLARSRSSALSTRSTLLRSLPKSCAGATFSHFPRVFSFSRRRFFLISRIQFGFLCGSIPFFQGLLSLSVFSFSLDRSTSFSITSARSTHGRRRVFSRGFLGVDRRLVVGSSLVRSVL